jgi:hypothetical protein
MNNKPTTAKKEEPQKTQEEIDAENLDATWDEVYQQCCVHSCGEWFMIFVGLCAVVVLLYFFLFGLDLIGTGAKVMSGCRAYVVSSLNLLLKMKVCFIIGVFSNPHGFLFIVTTVPPCSVMIPTQLPA